MSIVKANYKQDVLATSMNGKRQYKLNPVIGTSNYEIEDVTEYQIEGDSFGASDINTTNLAIMGFSATNVTFNADGSITETDALGNSVITTFNEDGSIKQELRDTATRTVATAITTFNEDGSITTSVS